MHNPNKHHFIPAFYLKRWSGPDGLLVEWSKPYRTVKPIRRHPNAAAFQSGLYSFDGFDSHLQQWFETAFLGDTDYIASEVLQRMIARDVHSLSDREKSGWVRFLMTLRFRHPDVVAELREGNSKLWKHHDRRTKASYESIRTDNDPPTFTEWIALQPSDVGRQAQIDLLVAAMDNPTLGLRILPMVWEAIDTSTVPHRLLTSDWPIEICLGSSPQTVVLPISPSCLFLAYDDPNAMNGFGDGDLHRLVVAVNAYVVGCARRYMFSSDERQETFIRNRMSSTKVKPPFFPTLKAELATYE